MQEVIDNVMYLLILGIIALIVYLIKLKHNREL